MITAEEALKITESNANYQTAVKVYLERMEKDISKAASNGKRSCVLCVASEWPEFEAVHRSLIDAGFVITSRHSSTFLYVNW